MSLPPVGPNRRDSRDRDGLAEGLLSSSLNQGGMGGASPDVSSMWTPMMGSTRPAGEGGAGGVHITDAMRTPTMGRATQLKMR